MDESEKLDDLYYTEKVIKKLEEQNFHLPTRVSPIYKFHIVDSGNGIKAHTIVWTPRHHPLAISPSLSPYVKSLENYSVHKVIPPHSNKRRKVKKVNS